MASEAEPGPTTSDDIIEAHARAAAARAEELFAYDQLQGDVLEQGKAALQEINSAGQQLVHLLLLLTPRSADQQAAIRNVRVALHQAGDAIFLNGKG